LIKLDNSQSLVIGDFYVEQAELIFNLKGNTNDTMGSLTIGHATKIHTYNKVDPNVLTADGYRGNVNLIQASLTKYSANNGIDKLNFIQKDTNPNFNILMLGLGVTNTESSVNDTYTINVKGKSFVLQSSIRASLENKRKIISMSDTSQAMPYIRSALNDLRKLSEYDK